jgi:MinD-like ATPase involved in chromosome partitioning or flagellar assembly
VTIPAKHLDEARQGAVDAMTQIMVTNSGISAAAIIDDLFGRISVVLWFAAHREEQQVLARTRSILARMCGQYWTDDITVADVADPTLDQDVLRRTVWDEGVAVAANDRLRLNDRHRNHAGWFVGAETSEQLWSLDEGPPIVVFHGFKGGVGRTTLLASYAIACARRAERVTVVDMDLDAPGIGPLLPADVDGTIARWGIVDFFLEAGQQLPLDDYFHVCSSGKISDTGRLEVFPAGSLDDAYLSKLARVDLNVRDHVRSHPLGRLLQRIRSERLPDVILLDGRAGLSPAAGLLLSGIAHLHVLVSTSNPGSLKGLERVVRHLGFEQARRELPQRECIVVQAHVPDSTEVAKAARDYFASRIEDIFRNGYYSQQSTEDDRTWSLDDLESEVAPHAPISISYRGRLAHFSAIDEISEILVSDPEYTTLHQRIDERLGRSQREASSVVEEDGRG